MKYLHASILSVLLLSLYARAQVTSSTSDAEARPSEIIKAEDAVNRVLLDSGVLFREGLLAYGDSNLAVANGKFNKSVEVFLYSTLNIQREQRLQGCYSQLIETIYRIEFPADNQLPQVSNLTQTCNWNSLDKSLSIDSVLTEKIATMAKRSPANTKASGIPVRIGFTPQEFQPSSLDELSKLELTPDERQIGKTAVQPQKLYGQTWQSISNRTGVGIAQLMAANPGMAVPAGRVFVPVLDNNASTIVYSTPTNISQTPPVSSMRVVTAKANDTVAKVAERYQANVMEIAKYNGLLPHSVLGAGREIRIPVSGKSVVQPHYLIGGETILVPVRVNLKLSTRQSVADEIRLFGNKPSQAKDGKVGLVMNYFNEVLDDPYSARFVRWSPVTKTEFGGAACWRVNVKYRAKNKLGAYVLSERVFYIRRNKIVTTFELD